jgi:hypothetical protein
MVRDSYKYIVNNKECKKIAFFLSIFSKTLNNTIRTKNKGGKI